MKLMQIPLKATSGKLRCGQLTSLKMFFFYLKFLVHFLRNYRNSHPTRHAVLFYLRLFFSKYNLMSENGENKAKKC